MTGDFIDNDSWNNGTDDVPVPLDGRDLAEYEYNVHRAVERHNICNGGNLMFHFDKARNPGVKAKVMSAIPSVEIYNGELMSCTTVKLQEPLTKLEMEDLQDYLKEQFSNDWGESFDRREIRVNGGIIGVHFWEADKFLVEVEQPVSNRPKMKLVGMDGNIFSILGRASRLLKENGQPDQAKEMSNRVYQSGDYYKALNIISEYVETELSEKTPPK